MNTAQLQAGGGIGNGDGYGSIGLDILTTDGFDVSPSTTAAGVPAVGVGGVPGDEEDNRIATIYVRGGKSFSDNLRTNAVARADFDEEGGRWRLKTTSGEEIEADVLVSACGQLSRPA